MLDTVVGMYVNKHYTDSALKELMVFGGKKSHEQNEYNVVSTMIEGCPGCYRNAEGRGLPLADGWNEQQFPAGEGSTPQPE